jgi:thioredoxin reductase (NADPH)
MLDLIIIGGGPGGLSSAIYGLRAKLDVLLIEKIGLGGQIAKTDIIENYPGFISLTGPELVSKFEEHAKSFGLNNKFGVVAGIDDHGDRKVVKTDFGEIECRAVIIATGASPKKLKIKGEEEFHGRGVSYCATCDGPFYKDKDVLLVGGGDTAVKEAIYLTKIAKKVRLVHRRNRLRAEKIMQDMILSNPKVEFHWDSKLEEINGDNSGVTGARINKVDNSEPKEINVDGVFIFVGINSNSEFINVNKDEGGFIITNDKMETSTKGIYAIGDIRNTPLRQVVTAVGDGAIAAVMAEEYISLLKGTAYPGRSQEQ